MMLLYFYVFWYIYKVCSVSESNWKLFDQFWTTQVFLWGHPACGHFEIALPGLWVKSNYPRLFAS
jgi:hypothetical protein